MKTRLSMDELQRRTTLIGAPDVFHSDYKEVGGGEEFAENPQVEVDSFDSVVFEGNVIFTRSYEGWSSRVYVNPTFADALRAMQNSMKATGDMHHVFFEGLGDPKGRRKQAGPCDHCGHTPEPGTKYHEIAIHTGS
jgi:hypothetical protein